MTFYIPIVLLLLGVIGGINGFKPSKEMAVNAVYIAMGITVVSLPFTIITIKAMRSPFVYKLLAGFIIFPLNFMMFGWISSIGFFGYMMNKFEGSKTIKIVKVVEKKTCRFIEKHCHCDTKVRVETDLTMVNGSLCTNKSFWDAANVGDELRLTGLESKYGFQIYNYENITLTKHSTTPGKSSSNPQPLRGFGPG